MKTHFLFTLLILLAAISSPIHAQNTFVVNTWFDQDDLVPGDGVCLTIFSDCSLRAAIEEANALPNSGGPDVILFTDIPILVWFAMISVTAYLPPITDPVVIDGTTAAGEVIINGTNAPAPGPQREGLFLDVGSSGSTIRGLSIGNFKVGLLGWNGIHVRSDDNVIEKNHIGVLSDGTEYGNNGYGIYVEGDYNRIGGVGKENVIGFNAFGIWVTNGYGTIIRSNYIGMSPSGQNIANGWGIFLDDTRNTTIGGPTSQYGNRIGFNENEGINIAFGSNDTIVRNNFIGTDASGNDRGNGSYGIEIKEGSNGNTIGGIRARANIIGFNGDGIRIGDVDDNIIRGNFIGTNQDGHNLGNIGAGIVLDGESLIIDEEGPDHNVIGYAADTEIPANARLRNTIAFNGGSGIVVKNDSLNTAHRNSIRGNEIYENGGTGIDLNDDGPTSNDSDDADTGPNTLLNYPDVTRAFYRPGSDEIVIEYSISSDDAIVSYPLTVDVYLADDSTSGEGKTYIGTDIYTTPNEADSFRVEAGSTTWASTDYVVLTTTDADGNTSEFSPPAGALGTGPGSVAGALLTDTINLSTNTTTQTTVDTAYRAPRVGAYPNPFNPQTTVTIGLPVASHIRISVHDMLGRQVALLHDGNLSAGTSHTFTFNGAGLASGAYLLRVAGDDFIESRRITLLK